VGQNSQSGKMESVKHNKPSVIRAVPLAKMRVAINAQRELKPYRVDELLSRFDIDMLGYPVVNLRPDGFFYVIDGQHRVETLKRWLGGDWERQSLDCQVYTNMSEKDEALMFDALQFHLPVDKFSAFKVRVTAGRSDETAVLAIVRACGLHVARKAGPGAVCAVGALVKVYKRTDGPTLARTLGLLYNSFGEPGLSSAMIEGMGFVCQRYNGAIEDKSAVDKLSQMRGGVGAVITRATMLRKQTGSQLTQCVAASLVDSLNAGRGHRKLPSWWKVHAVEES
jgi:hypothetical protein